MTGVDSIEKSLVLSPASERFLLAGSRHIDPMLAVRVEKGGAFPPKTRPPQGHYLNAELVLRARAVVDLWPAENVPGRDEDFVRRQLIRSFEKGLVNLVSDHLKPTTPEILVDALHRCRKGYGPDLDTEQRTLLGLELVAILDEYA